MILTRRDFLKYTGSASAFALASAAFPKLSFASLPTDNRFILVLLRGALDGMAAIPPYGDPNYAPMRGALAFRPPGSDDGAVDLNGFYGLHPSLAPLQPYYAQGQLAFVHAAASPYRERSHFDAQKLLENGSTAPNGELTGWLNRTLVTLGGTDNSSIAINQQIPLVLQGKLGAASWAPKGGKLNEDSDYMRKMQSLYSQDTLLSGTFQQGLQTQEMAQASLPADDQMAGGKAKPAAQLLGAAQAASMFLSRDDGPRVAVLEASGWDTHAGQGTSHGALANRLGDLGQALASLPQGMGKAWDKTVVVVATEFGRTVHVNGTNGTDHGTAGMMMVMGGGGRIRGGKVYGKWPGLAENNLYQARDLMPTTDMRSVFRTVLYSHLHVPADALNNTIFPESGGVPYMRELIA